MLDPDVTSSPASIPLVQGTQAQHLDTVDVPMSLPHPYSAAAQPSAPAVNTDIPAGQPMSASFPGVSFNPSSGVTIHPSGLPQLSWATNGTPVSVPGLQAAFQGAASMPALAGPQFLVNYQNPASSGGKFTFF